MQRKISFVAARGRAEMFRPCEKLSASRLSGLSVRCFGAITSKPYAFTARPWELKQIETVDVIDGMGSSIMVGYILFL